MWRRILVPHDFTDGARRALEVACGLAKVHGAELHLLHVSPLPPNLPGEAIVQVPGSDARVRVDALLTRGSQQGLEAIAEPARGRGVVVHVLARTTDGGDPSRGILDAADEVRADAIVLGTHGRRGLAHLLLGSVAEKVVREARVPVVTVRCAAPEAVPTREESLAEDELTG